MQVSELIDTKHAARILGFHANSIRRWLTEGKLPGKKIMGRWRAWRPAVEALAQVNKQGVEVPDVPQVPNYDAWVDATLKRFGVR